ncbi:MAG: hypothetical protein ACI8WB_005515 [Phenylobacterium sp.]|jgi:hypothetical protein
MKNYIPILIIIFTLVISGCTTRIAGRGLTPVADQPHQHTIKVYTGGFAFTAKARERALEQVESFLKDNPQYSSYKEIYNSWRLIPSGATFIYEFK